MADKKFIKVYVTYDRKEYRQVAIPAGIDEINLKARLRDLGYISSHRRTYYNTKVYLESHDNRKLEEICTDEYRSLEELGIGEKSLIFIEEEEFEPEPKRYYVNPESMKCLYGCPMAQSVKEAINQAERYSDDDSSVTTGSIGLD